MDHPGKRNMSSVRDPISPKTVFIIVTIIVLVLAGVAIGLTWRYAVMIDRSGEVGGGPDPNREIWSSEKEANFQESGLLYDDRDPQMDSFAIDRSMALIYFTAILTWTDEPSDIGFTNEPDNFKMVVRSDGKEQIGFGENIYDNEGLIRIDVINGNLTIEKVDRIEIDVTLIFAGEQLPNGGPAWMEKEDNSNIYELDVSYTYKERI